MKDIKVISINPGKTTDGARNFELLEKVMRTCRPVTNRAGIPKMKYLYDTLFGINKTTSDAESSKILLIRTLAAVYFISLGIITLNSWHDATHFTAIFSIVIGVSLFLGLMSRIVSVAGIIVFGYISAFSIFHFTDIFTMAAFNVSYSTSLAQTLICIIMAVSGPGKYSADQLIRKSIMKATHKHLRRVTEERASSLLSYKAWKVQ